MSSLSLKKSLLIVDWKKTDERSFYALLFILHTFSRNLRNLRWLSLSKPLLTEISPLRGGAGESLFSEIRFSATQGGKSQLAYYSTSINSYSFVPNPSSFAASIVWVRKSSRSSAPAWEARCAKWRSRATKNSVPFSRIWGWSKLKTENRKLIV